MRRVYIRIDPTELRGHTVDGRDVPYVVGSIIDEGNGRRLDRGPASMDPASAYDQARKIALGRGYYVVAP